MSEVLYRHIWEYVENISEILGKMTRIHTPGATRSMAPRTGQMPQKEPDTPDARLPHQVNNHVILRNGVTKDLKILRFAQNDRDGHFGGHAKQPTVSRFSNQRNPMGFAKKEEAHFDRLRRIK